MVEFYKCMHCGQIVTKVNDTGVNVVCCGEAMKLLKANTTDAANEKHVPVITRNGNVVHVSVGNVAHPMTSEHYIMWIVLETTKGVKIAHLTPSSAPSASFALLDDEEVVNAYEYCNLHSLWSVK